MSDTTASGHKSVLLIGGPDAGKSNFLFRLWIAIDDGRGALVKDGLPSDLEYLRHGAEQLLDGEFAGRTSKEVHERIVVPVKSSADGAAPGGHLVVPDIAGEQILAIYRNRQWSKEWEELISHQCACLLFVRAGSDKIVAPLDWTSCFEKYGSAIPIPGPVTQVEVMSAVAAAITNDSENTMEHPTQVVLTDWLQFLRRALTAVAGGAFRPRVGVVISAWDAVPNDQQHARPLLYLKDNFPMLHQFVEANGGQFDFQIFGLSIVDGDLKNDEEFKETYSNGTPQDFGFVVHSLSGQLTRSHDITLPVAWALRLLPGVS